MNKKSNLKMFQSLLLVDVVIKGNNQIGNPGSPEVSILVVGGCGHKGKAGLR